MAKSYYFYDLETSGLNPRSARIMQFAGQRTDENFKPIGEPLNTLITLTADVLPDPQAVLITGITPQQTISEGISEAEFLKLFYSEVVQPDTIFLGFNTIRFDDEFMRFMHFRNFYDPYEWQWQNGCSRWDILDVLRMTRALRPDGISWPFTAEGKPTNRLELLTKLNKLDHNHAHDALNDVLATIAVTKLIHAAQPKLFKYLLDLRDKKKVAHLLQSGSPFVYTSGRLPVEFLHTTVAVQLAHHTQQDAVLVYDLRHDPTPFLKMNLDELQAAWVYSKDKNRVRLPVKTIKYNRAPAVAPLGVLDKAAQKRLTIDLKTVATHLSILQKDFIGFSERVSQVVKRMDEDRMTNSHREPVEAQLYDKFLDARDKPILREIRNAEPDEITILTEKFSDQRLRAIGPLYKARNFPNALTTEEKEAWDKHCAENLLTGGIESSLATYLASVQTQLQLKPTAEQQYLLEELLLYGQSLVPMDE